MAKMARLAYEEPDAIQRQVAEWGFPDFRFFEANETRCGGEAGAA